MNLIHLRYFVELSRTGSYTQAAKRLCITQPSLSHAMAQLEEELGAPLFRRQGRTTALTPLGEQFLTAVRQSLDVLDRGIEEVRQAARGAGLLRIGMVRPLAVELVPKLAGAFLKERPEGEVRFAFHTDVTHALLGQLEAGELDAVFSSPPPEQLGLSSHPVGRQDLVVIVPEDHPLAGRGEIDLGELLDTDTACSPGRAGCPSPPMRRRTTRPSPDWWPGALGRRWCRTWSCSSACRCVPWPSAPRCGSGSSAWCGTTAAPPPC